MINTLNCVKLHSMRPNRHQVDFVLDELSIREGDALLKIQTDLSQGTDANDSEKCKLTFMAKVEIKDEDGGSPLFNLSFGVDYFFDIVNSDIFNSLSDDNQVSLCSSLVYMDYRRRLLLVLSIVGMNSIKLPLSLLDLTIEL